MPEPNSGCWLWIGSTSHGYGQTNINGRPQRTHRVSYEYHIGPIPDDQCVLHKCDNPPCVNPSHLFLGSQQENLKDMKVKGRGIKGEMQGQAKLKAKDIPYIRADE